MQNLIIKVDNMAEDPICKMDVDENSKFKSRFKDYTYYFCSVGCKEKFDESPDKYAQK